MPMYVMNDYVKFKKSVSGEAIQSTRKTGNCWAGRPGLRGYGPIFSQALPTFASRIFTTSFSYKYLIFLPA